MVNNWVRFPRRPMAMNAFSRPQYQLFANNQSATLAHTRTYSTRTVLTERACRTTDAASPVNRTRTRQTTWKESPLRWMHPVSSTCPFHRTKGKGKKKRWETLRRKEKSSTSKKGKKKRENNKLNRFRALPVEPSCSYNGRKGRSQTGWGGRVWGWNGGQVPVAGAAAGAAVAHGTAAPSPPLFLAPFLPTLRPSSLPHQRAVARDGTDVSSV